MSSKYNQLYGNSALNRALGNIAKTLVGSATDDAAIARANYLEEQYSACKKCLIDNSQALLPYLKKRKAKELRKITANLIKE